MLEIFLFVGLIALFMALCLGEFIISVCMFGALLCVMSLGGGAERSGKKAFEGDLGLPSITLAKSSK